MLTKPLNEELLWKGAIQAAKYPQPICKADMVGFTRINSLTGVIVKNQPSINDELACISRKMSYNYWNAVEMRKRLYRLERVF